MSGAQYFRAGQCSESGVKASNEDSCGIRIPDEPLLLTKGLAAVIADGMSGSEAGREAADACVQGACQATQAGVPVIPWSPSWHSASRPQDLDKKRENFLLLLCAQRSTNTTLRGYVFVRERGSASAAGRFHVERSARWPLNTQGTLPPAIRGLREMADSRVGVLVSLNYPK
jgi:hypothetical protein